MDEIEKRLRESTEAFIKNFENWVKQSKNLESREVLMESMHEVRKVVSRVEIEIAISERDRLGTRPLPIPPHRSSRKPGGDTNEGNDDVDFNTHQDDGDEGQQPEGNGSESAAPRRSGPPRSGGRRPMHQNRGDRGNNTPQS